MNNQLQIFNNPEFEEIRTIKENGKILFCGSDVAKALGYVNPNKAINNHCRAITKYSTPISGKIQEINFITEGDVYRLITHSKLPKVEQFEKWVFDEVLPIIRQTGVYMTPETIEKVLYNPDFIIGLATQVKTLQLENKQKDQIIGELQPKANYVDKILDNKGLVTITQIAKDYGMSGKEFNKLLHSLGVQYKQNDQWLLYSKYQGQGYTHSRTFVFIRYDGARENRMETKWTQKGRLFIYELLKEKGIVPLIEQEQDQYAN